jgi:branched-chain amino acid aminotransferase
MVYVNGKISDAREASVPVFDHGFLYGEGVYETLRTYARVPFLFDRHMARLRRSAGMIGVSVPFSDDDLLARVHQTMAAEADPGEAYVRILLTRGVGDLTYEPAACPTPTLVIIVKPLAVYPERTFTEGIRVSLVSVRRNHPNALNPLIKSNNLLNNALAMQEALRAGAAEALMQNQAGELVECSQSNFFVVRDGVVMTPPLSAGLLPGITRELVLEIATEAGLIVKETRLRPLDLSRVDEAFITGTTREVTPVVAVDEVRIGAGVPGGVTRLLLVRFRQRAN